MKRLLPLIALPLLLVTAACRDDAPARLVSLDEPSTTSTTAEAPATTTTSSTTEVHHEPTTTTSTTEVRHGPTTTTTAPPHTDEHPSQLLLKCVAGDKAVSCHWDGIPDGATSVAMLREEPTKGPAQPIWTGNPSERDHDDTSARTGTTYAYRVSAYKGDTFLATSNSVRVQAGGGTASPEPEGTVQMQCTSTHDTTVHCIWGGAPTGTAKWRLLRQSDEASGRVVGAYSPDVHTADDQNVPSGERLYYVQALDGGGKVIGYGRATVDCCAADRP